MTRLDAVASRVRSKNAGPFWVTIDIFCSSNRDFTRLKETKGLGPQGIAGLFGVCAADVKRFDIASLNVIKISFPRPDPQGSSRDADMHAGQLFVPLLSIDVDQRES